jgi:hypothetical protein
MEDQDYFDAIHRAELADRTKAKYIENLKRLKRLTNFESIERLLRNPTMVNEKLQQTIENKSSRVPYMTAVIAVFKHAYLRDKMSVAHTKWMAFYEPLSKEVTAARESNKPTQSQMESFVKWDDVIAKRDSLALGTTEQLFLDLYIHFTRRQRDFYNIHILRDTVGSCDEGYLYLPEDKSIEARINIVEGKTLGPGEFFNEVVPPHLRESVEASLAKVPRTHLLMAGMPEEGKRDVIGLTRYTNEVAFLKWSNRLLSRLFHPKVTVNSLRHAKVNWIREHVNWSVARRNHEANLMGHLRSQSDLYVFIPEENDDRVTQTGPIGSIDETNIRTGVFIDDSGIVKRVRCVMISEKTIDISENDRNTLMNMLKFSEDSKLESPFAHQELV